jgi:sugar-specific transcriptional regulator TrmB
VRRALTTVDSFTELGLSSYQAETYVALLDVGSSDAKSLANSTRVPYSKVYSVLKALNEYGLVKVSSSRPQVYYPVSPDEAVTHLRQRIREKQENLLKSVVDDLMPLYNKTRVSERAEIEIIHDVDVAMRRVLNVAREAKSEIRAVIPDVTEAQFEQLGFLVEGLSRVGISLSILTTVGNLSLFSDREFLAETRDLIGSPIGLLISDSRKVFAVFVEEGRFYSLFTENSFLVKLSVQLFERLWDMADEVPAE